MLLPGLRRIRRDGNAIQVGVAPRHAVVVEFAHPGTATVLRLLDGRHTEAEITREAVASGADPGEVRALLDTLRAQRLVLPAGDLCTEWLPEPVRRRLRAELAALALRGALEPAPPGAPRQAPPGALEPAPPGGSAAAGERCPAGPARLLRRRAAARVRLTGSSMLLLPTATALAAAGVGALHTVSAGRVDRVDAALTALAPGDLGRWRSTIAAEVLRRCAPGTRTHPFPARRATMVVRFGPAPPVSLDALAWRHGGPALLSAVVREGTVVIGPLLRPPGGPCPSCLDLHRRDRDPIWPAVAAQLLTCPGGEEPCAVATVLTAVGWLTAEVLAHIDGVAPRSAGATIEVDGPDRVRRRSWPTHPACDCIHRSRVPGARTDSAG